MPAENESPAVETVPASSETTATDDATEANREPTTEPAPSAGAPAPVDPAKAPPKPGSFADLQARGKALGLKVVGITKADLESAIAAATGVAPIGAPAQESEAIRMVKAAAESGHPIEVVESFTTRVKGQDIHYRKGELVHPDDPVFARSPELFRPMVYPHPVTKRGTLGTPEIRS